VHGQASCQDPGRRPGPGVQGTPLLGDRVGLEQEATVVEVEDPAQVGRLHLDVLDGRDDGHGWAPLPRPGYPLRSTLFERTRKGTKKGGTCAPPRMRM